MSQRFDRDHSPPDGSTATRPREELPIGDLVKLASEQAAQLVRQELKLAQLELTGKARDTGKGGALVAVAAVLALFGAAVIVATVILALATAMPAWVASLIVAGALLLAAGGIAKLGIGEIKRATPPTPEMAVQGVRDDIDEIKTRVSAHG